jgi:hypothetical protein
MSESEQKSAAPMDQQLELLVAEVESKFIDAEDALSELRHAIRNLKAYRPAEAPSAPPAPAPRTGPTYDLPKEWALDVPGAEQAEAEEAAPSRPGLDQETVGVPFWTGPNRPAPEPEHTIEDYGMDSTSEASWPIARSSDREAEVAPPAPPEPEATPAPSAGDEDDEARRDEVARIVAQMREGGDEDEPQETPAEDDDEAKRRDVAKMVADLRDGVDVEPEPPTENGNGPSGEDDEARREEVARMVAEMRESGLKEEAPPAEAAQDDDAKREEVARMVAQMREGGQQEDEASAEAETDDEAKREDVASMVAQMRAEMDSGASTEEDATQPADESDEEVRDEVRKAVEAARAEMASGYKEPEDEEEGADKRFSFPDWQATHAEPSGPPVIVIKDSEGRVELARVYETLSRVNCDDNAALLNYTPHSVTVGLNAKASVPEVEAMTEAVKATFGRACEVDSDGTRVNVQIGKDLKGKDSAA